MKTIYKEILETIKDNNGKLTVSELSELVFLKLQLNKNDVAVGISELIIEKEVNVDGNWRIFI